MKKVTCTLPNVSDEINGIKFELDDGVATAELEDDVAAQFDGIPGYEIADAGKKSAAKGAGKGKEPESKPEGGQTPPGDDQK